MYLFFGKRLLDTVGAATALVVLAPLLAVLVVVVRFKLGAPGLFRQQRPGLHGQPFTIYKLRTMNSARDTEGRLLPDEARATPLGCVLRRLSLDELPELWNVLKGEMSLVGPRPLLVEYLPLYDTEQARRHSIRPGITGWAQINGRNAVSWQQRFKLDVWYVENVSLALDLRILASTVRKVIKREGISAEGHASMPQFTGGRN